MYPVNFKSFIIALSIIFAILLSIHQNDQLLFAQFEDFDGIWPGDPNKLTPTNIIVFNENLTTLDNKTEIEEAIEKSYISEDIIISNKSYAAPQSDTLVPNATILNQEKFEQLSNISFLDCKNCYLTYKETDKVILHPANMNTQHSLRSSDYSNVTIPLIETDIGYINATDIPEAAEGYINATFISDTEDKKLYNVTLKKIEMENRGEIIKTLVAEPTIAKKNDTLIFVNNYYMARSLDDGESWTLLTLNNDMENIDICCDNRIIYDNNHEIFIWYAQGEMDDSTNTNINRIGVSKDGITWLMYYFKPSDIRPFLNKSSFDFPHLVAGNNYLYLLTAVTSPSYLHGIVIKIPFSDLIKCDPSKVNIDKLSDCNITFEYYFSLKKLNFAPIYNPDDVLYWATHITNDKIRIYNWSENSTSYKDVKFRDISIAPFSILRKNNTACDPANTDYRTNWCLRTDSRILTGWKNGDLLGFFWNADYKANNVYNKTFHFPYIEGATLKMTSEGFEYVGRPYLYNTGTVFLYPSVAVNSKGEIGLLSYFGEEILKPSIIFGTTNNISTNIPWNVEILKKSTDIPSVYFNKNDTKAWGDFITLQPDGEGWYGTAFVLEGGNTEEHIQPYYIKIKKDIKNNVP